MIYEISTNTTDWKIFPSTELEEISQNILMIILTPKYSVPLDRAFGIDYTLLDAPINNSQALMTAEIVQAINTFEPRAKVTEIIYNSSDLAKLDCTVRFRLNEV